MLQKIIIIIILAILSLRGAAVGGDEAISLRRGCAISLLAPKAVGNQNDQYHVWLERELQQGPYLAKGKLRDSIFVKRNNVSGKKPGQVKIRVCEISELTEDERGNAANALEQWFKFSDYRYVLHSEFVSDLIRVLRDDVEGGLRSFGMPVTRVYLAISVPDINNESEVDIEGYVAVSDNMTYFDYETTSVIVNWEIKPRNRSKAIGILEKPLPPSKAARFVGVGHQLLCAAIVRELRMGYRGFVFDINADDELKDKGIECVPLSSPVLPDHVYSPHRLMSYVNNQHQVTGEILRNAAVSGDKGADEILKEITAEAVDLPAKPDGGEDDGGPEVAAGGMRGDVVDLSDAEGLGPIDWEGGISYGVGQRGKEVKFKAESGNFMEELTEFLEKKGIKDGIILMNGKGTFTNSALGFFMTDQKPRPDFDQTVYKGKAEIETIMGTIVNGIPHVHVLLDPAGEGREFVGGHLIRTEDSDIEVKIIPITGFEGKRAIDPDTGVGHFRTEQSRDTLFNAGDDILFTVARDEEFTQKLIETLREKGAYKVQLTAAIGTFRFVELEGEGGKSTLISPENGLELLGATGEITVGDELSWDITADLIDHEGNRYSGKLKNGRVKDLVEGDVTGEPAAPPSGPETNEEPNRAP